jgi:hypothetical protein
MIRELIEARNQEQQGQQNSNHQQQLTVEFVRDRAERLRLAWREFPALRVLPVSADASSQGECLYRLHSDAGEVTPANGAHSPGTGTPGLVRNMLLERAKAGCTKRCDFRTTYCIKLQDRSDEGWQCRGAPDFPSPLVNWRRIQRARLFSRVSLLWRAVDAARHFFQSSVTSSCWCNIDSWQQVRPAKHLRCDTG